MSTSIEIKIYNGYGHSKNMVVYGHVFKGKRKKQPIFDKKGWKHTLSLLKLFFLRPIGNVRLRLFFYDQIYETTADEDGFFKFKWSSSIHLEAGLHDLKIGFIKNDNSTDCFTDGKIYVPHSTQYAFVSDIDDTVLISHSATIWRRLRELLAKNAYRRKLFSDNVVWYNMLSRSGTDPEHLNPFFYVSSSEWNLYDYLHDIFSYNKLPAGSFLLSHFKRWHAFFKTGRTKHEDKYRRIARLLRVFPKQKFVLIGDNSQRDPIIYTALVNDYPDRITAIYIRNIKKKRTAHTLQLFNALSPAANIQTCLFNTNNEAIEHSVSIGLITREECLG